MLLQRRRFSSLHNLYIVGKAPSFSRHPNVSAARVTTAAISERGRFAMVWFDRIIDPTKEKRCSHCRRWLSFYEFTKDPSNRDGHDSWCKDCRRTYYKENIEEIAFKKHVYRQTHKDKVQAYTKRYWKENKEKLSQRYKEYIQSEQGKQVRAAIRERHKEKLKKKYREWQRSKAGQESGRRRGRRYRAKMREASCNVTDEGWCECLEWFDYQCAVCGLTQQESLNLWGRVLDMGHAFVPLSKGGGYDIDNLVPLCTSCNAKQRINIIFSICDTGAEQRIREYFEHLGVDVDEKVLRQG